jgi:hypothetical protein
MDRSGLDDRVIVIAGGARAFGTPGNVGTARGSAVSILTNNLDRVAARGSMPGRHCSNRAVR